MYGYKNVPPFIPSLIYVVVTCYPAAMPGAAPCHYVQHLLRGVYCLDSQWVFGCQCR